MIDIQGVECMNFKYKIDVIAALKEKGYSTYKIRKEKIFGESTLQAFRKNEPVAFATLDQVCELLDMDYGDLITRGITEPQYDSAKYSGENRESAIDWGAAIEEVKAEQRKYKQSEESKSPTYWGYKPRY